MDDRLITSDEEQVFRDMAECYPIPSTEVDDKFLDLFAKDEAKRKSAMMIATVVKPEDLASTMLNKSMQPKDGDGDGFVFDGTPRERRAPIMYGETPEYIGSSRARVELRSNGTPEHPENKHVYTVPTSSIETDPARFQYKVKGIGADGVTQELKGTTTWNPELGGVMLVWRDPETGKDFVVNGHHRHELARRTGTDEINVRYIDASNHRVARARGALANIAEGRGTAVDAAKFLRDARVGIDDLKKYGVSLTGAIASDAMVLRKLSDKSFESVTRGLIDESRAIAVAKYLDDPVLQDKLFKKIEQREEDGKGEWTGKEIEAAAKKMASAGKVASAGTDLFGDWESEESTFDQEVEIEAYIRRQLTQEANDFRSVASAKRAERVAVAGNVLVTDENAKRQQQAELVADEFEREVGLKGPVADTVKKFAAELFAAKKKSEKASIKESALAAIRSVLTEKGGENE